MTFADALGWDTDPAGDAARRDALSGARITPEMVAAVNAAQDRALAAAPAPVPDDHDVQPGHVLTTRAGLSGTEVTCECGRWDGWFNGPRSRRRVMDDYAAHVAAELKAQGPLRVEAVRLDTPEPEP